MSRSQRLFDLLQLLRCHKYPVAAEKLAQELNVSTRTIYRDIVTLQSQGADIQGEAGMGYVLRAGFMLPPLMLSSDELEALLLGADWIAKQANGEFKKAAKNAIAKISAVLPEDHQIKRRADIMRVSGIIEVADLKIDLAEIRRAVQEQFKVEIEYVDVKGESSTRVIWPILIGVFQQYYVLAAYCENRQNFRHFRLDRILAWHTSSEQYSTPRHQLLKQWQAIEGIKEKDIFY